MCGAYGKISAAYSQPSNQIMSIGMSHDSLHAPTLSSFVDDCLVQAKRQVSQASAPRVVISPYRFNPLGAHVDHQGGPVLARCLDQYTLLCFWPTMDATSTVHCCINGSNWETAVFTSAELQDNYGWDAMARASFAALANYQTLDKGIEAVVFGTLISGGLSSSSSVILAYLSALADVNGFSLTAEELVELSRRVENDYRGLNNGIQDQMSIAFARQNHLTVLDVNKVEAQLVVDPPNISEVCFLMCYSGVSRDLAGSPFNTRVSECQQAARLLDVNANRLGDVPEQHRSEAALAQLPDLLKRRASHVYSEISRVQLGAAAWQRGDWSTFGQLMKASCQSSINDYESGSEWLIALHEIANTLPGVYGNRFSGGGYGGCLFMLCDAKQLDEIAESLMNQYIDQYPELKSEARVLIAKSESTVRIVQP